MFDDLQDIVSLHDFFNPLVSFFQDLANGPHRFFGIPLMAGWSKREIGRILRRHGVKVWGLMYGEEEIIFTVRKDQAKRAYDVLTREDVPILYPSAVSVQANE